MNNHCDNGFFNDNVAAKVARWQSEGLMPVNDFGEVLIWKCVKPVVITPYPNDWNSVSVVGNMGAAYKTGTRFRALGLEYRLSMGCAGPWGCIREFAPKRDALWLMAIWAPLMQLRRVVYPKNPRITGVFSMRAGTAGALYIATNIDNVNGIFDPICLVKDPRRITDAFSMINGGFDTRYEPQYALRGANVAPLCLNCETTITKVSTEIRGSLQSIDYCQTCRKVVDNPWDVRNETH